MLRIEVELAVEPSLTLVENIWPVLLGRMRGLFLYVIRRRSKKRQSVAMPKRRPCSLSFACSSASVMSEVLSTKARINVACASIRPERRSPPCGFD